MRNRIGFFWFTLFIIGMITGFILYSDGGSDFEALIILSISIILGIFASIIFLINNSKSKDVMKSNNISKLESFEYDKNTYITNQLLNLKKLKDEEIISEEEYKSKKEALLEQL